MADNTYDEVAEPCDEYKLMSPFWDMCDTLYAGTAAMREAGTKYLPKFEATNQNDYSALLKRTVLLNMYHKAIQSIVGRAFKKPIMLQDDVPAGFATWAENIDREGRSLNVFGKALLKSALKHGMTHFMVDFPMTQAKTLAEQKQAGDRPYWVHMPAKEIIGWQHEVVNGEKRLTQVRRWHKSKKASGAYGVKEVELITVYGINSFQVFEKVEGEKGGKERWVLAMDENGKPMEGATGVNYIPMVTYYTNRTGFMEAMPPLLDLAHKNIEHWQSSSDQRNILTFSRIPVLYLFGLGDEDKPIKWGPAMSLRSANENAKAGFIEVSGAAIGAGKEDLETLKEEMAFLSLDPMLRQTGNTTATARALDESGTMSQLDGWMVEFKDSIEMGLQFTADRMGEKSGGSVSVNDKFSVTTDGESNAKVINECYVAGLIPKEVAQEALRRCGLAALSETLEEYDNEDLKAIFEAEQRSNPAFAGLAAGLRIP
jgi:hypothetical protein